MGRKVRFLQCDYFKFKEILSYFPMETSMKGCTIGLKNCICLGVGPTVEKKMVECSLEKGGKI